VRVLFWGTPEFATPPLHALLGEGFEVTGVVTQPDKPTGRSRSTVMPSPVKQIALEEGLPVFQPEKLNDPEFLELIQLMAPDLSVVVAYGKLLPTRLIELPAKGTLNIHASLLPKLRGAAPIQAAIREGHRESGISIMRMVKALDAGPVLLERPTPILDDETFGELRLRLSEMGAAALIEALALMEAGLAQERPQDDSLATYAPKIDREMTRVDWSGEAVVVCRAIRAFDPSPGAFTTLRGKQVKLYGARVAGAGCASPGEVLDIDRAGMLVACGRGSVRILDAQVEGAKRRSVEEWSRGRGVAVGDRFGT
jgi:methionyl-tRNA formyltransferase